MLPGFEPSHSPALATCATPVAAKRTPTPVATVTPTLAPRHPRHGTQAAAHSPALTSVATLCPTASPAEYAATARAAACPATEPWWYNPLHDDVHHGCLPR